MCILVLEISLNLRIKIQHEPWLFVRKEASKIFVNNFSERFLSGLLGRTGKYVWGNACFGISL